MVSSDHIDLFTVMPPVPASGLIALHVGACTLTISDALDEQAHAEAHVGAALGGVYVTPVQVDHHRTVHSDEAHPYPARHAITPRTVDEVDGTERRGRGGRSPRRGR